MIHSYSCIEHRLVVPGCAVSFRSPYARNYKERIQKAAKSVFSSPLSCKVDVYIDYFYITQMHSDIDNIGKCVLDALTGIAYIDDKQVKIHQINPYDLQTQIRIKEGPVDIIKPLKKYKEYTFIRIREHN